MHDCNHRVDNAIDADPALQGLRAGAPPPRRTPRWLVKSCAVAGFMCLAATTAPAAVSVYTVEAARLGTVAAPTLIDFDNLADATPVSNPHAGVNFAPFNGGIALATEWRFDGFTSSNDDIARIDIAMGDGRRQTQRHARPRAPQLAGGAA